MAQASPAANHDRPGAGQPPADQPAEARTADVAATARALQDTVATLTVEDFRIEDFRFERDSRLGRDLLFLLSNNEWARRTTEVVDIGRVRAVDAQIVVDVDLSYVSHEAFRPPGEMLWLPILALPVERAAHGGMPDGGGPAPARNARRLAVLRRSRSMPASGVPDPITSLEVSDAAGARVTKVPQAEVHHWLAAVLAETLLPQLQRRVGGQAPPADARDQAVMLAASARRLLEQNLAGPAAADPLPAPGPAPGPALPAVVPGEGGLRRFEGRVTAARAALLETFRLDREQHRPVLASRVMEILDSLVGTVLVVVAVDRDPHPTSFTVRLPSRRLVRENISPLSLVPRARLRIDLLAATSHADRLIRLNLPVGVTWVPSADPAREQVARIEVRPPLPFAQLDALIRQLTRSVDERVIWVERRLAELAVDKVDASLQSLRYYRAEQPAVEGAGSQGRADPTEALAERLAGLRSRLRAVAASGGSSSPPPADLAAALAPKRELRAFWADGRWWPDRLERRLVVNTASPDAVQVRAPSIEDSTQRAEPTQACLDLDVAVTDSTVLDTARDTNAINLLLLIVVTALLVWHATSHPRGQGLQLDVLATVLTLFPAIQASRIERPDITTLRGLLTQPGYWLSLATAVPAILLAATIAVVPEWVAAYAAAAATGVQALLHLLIMQRGASPGPPGRPRRPRLRLATDHAPDHERFDLLRSTWCRALSADTLNLGRPAHAHVVLGPDGPGTLATLLAHPASPLALLRSAAAGTAMTLLVLRDEPDRAVRAGGAVLVRPVTLDVARLVPSEIPEWIVEVLIGIPLGSALAIPIGEHPVLAVVHAARASNFRVLFVEYPSPPPRRGRSGRQWLRLRIGVPYRRDDSLDGLRRFLAAMRRLQDIGPEGGYSVTVQIVPEMATFDATQTAPEETFSDAYSPARLRLVREHEVEVAEPDDGSVWRPLALCANARAGLVADALDSLTRRRPQLRIAAFTSAVVHGVSVTFVLCRDAEEAEPVEGHLGRLVALDLAGTDRLEVPIDGRRLPSAATPRDPDPGGAVAGPLLRMQIRTADRPAVLHDLLGWLTDTLQAQCLRLGIAPAELDVWSALVRVVDGRTMQGRITVRLPSDAAARRGWEGVDWVEVMRRRRADSTVLTIDLIRVEGERALPAGNSAGHSTQTSDAG